MPQLHWECSRQPVHVTSRVGVSHPRSKDPSPGMSKPVTRSIVALLLLSFPAAVFAQAPDANDPDFQEIRAYRLTMPTMNKVMQVAHDLSEAAEQRSSSNGKNVHTLSEMVEQIRSEAVVASVLARA